MNHLAHSSSSTPAPLRPLPGLGTVSAERALVQSSFCPSFVSGRSAAALWPRLQPVAASQPVRVLLLDDDPHMRQVIAQELLADLRCELLAKGGTTADARRLMALHPFDVLLVDLRVKTGDGLALLTQARALRPEAEVVVMADVEDEVQALQAFRLGARGYLVKTSWFSSFPQAVWQVANRGASLPPTLVRRLLDRLAQLECMVLLNNAEKPVAKPPEPVVWPELLGETLTNRELEVLNIATEGLSAAAIAARLKLSVQTVNTHFKNIYRKLKVRSRVQALTVAVQVGLL